ncbi:MAG: hypothetical protein K2Y25_16795 [Pseudomonadaceae bacterium]|jgi:hypothetical protein|nr:hypothetical protein [Pseudomonadaceae bacterium]
MTMTSCDLVVDFAAPLRFTQSVLAHKNRIHVDLIWSEPEQLISYFKLQPKIGIDQGLRWLEGAIELDVLLEYHGHSLAAAAEKFSELADQLEWRQEHADNGFLGAQQLEAFYRELQVGNQPLAISVAFIEHY